MAAPGQERTSEDVLTLDLAIELARANMRGAKRAKRFGGTWKSGGNAELARKSG
jgi:hypothetical protein